MLEIYADYMHETILLRPNLVSHAAVVFKLCSLLITTALAFHQKRDTYMNILYHIIDTNLTMHRHFQTYN